MVWAVLRRRRVQLLFGDGLLDLLSSYAPWAEELMQVSTTPCIGIFCRVFRAEVDGSDHVIVRSLCDNADLHKGNHWVAAVRCPRIEKIQESFRHPPCDGRLCAGGAAGHCVGLLRSAAAAANLAAIATTANGDCAFDTMALWEGGRPPRSRRLEAATDRAFSLHAREP